MEAHLPHIPVRETELPRIIAANSGIAPKQVSRQNMAAYSMQLANRLAGLHKQSR
ncbi:hypothetical protein EMIT0196MI5_120132 [Pseudomonas sp. IT-196MI5]